MIVLCQGEWKIGDTPVRRRGSIKERFDSYPDDLTKAMLLEPANNTLDSKDSSRTEALIIKINNQSLPDLIPQIYIIRLLIYNISRPAKEIYNLLIYNSGATVYVFNNKD